MTDEGGNSMKSYLTVPEVAERLQRHISRIEELIAIGYVPALHIPGDGFAVPVWGLPPYSRPSEEEG